MLDPDSIWLTIAQGFAHHVNSNCEELRARFVEHEDRLELIVPLKTFDTQSQDDWADLVERFATRVSEHTRTPTRS